MAVKTVSLEMSMTYQHLKKINFSSFLIVYQYNYFMFCTEVNDVSKTPHDKICFWVSMIAINVSVAICQLPVC